MSRDPQHHETPKWRTFWLMLAFVVLVGIGIVTVLRPELQDDPDDDVASQGQTDQEPEVGAPSHQ